MQKFIEGTMYKNRPQQILPIYIVDASGNPLTGKAATITCKISKDGGTPAATNDVNPTELSSSDMPGVNLFLLEREESNADMVIAYPSSTDPTVYFDPPVIFAYTRQ